jgi:Tol biopolymer transport system component
VPATGRIVFTCYIDDVDDLCAVNADGSRETRLTTIGATDFYASYAADGSQIVYSSRRDGSFLMYVMNQDGSGQQKLGPSNLGGIYAPAISPDGRSIAFTAASGGAQNIWVMDRNGGNPRQLTFFGGNSVDAVWSPDGRQIAFASDKDDPEGEQLSHYIVNIDGTGLRRLETGISDTGGRSDWSPDGRWLAFYAGPRNDREIYLLAIDGSVVHQLTDGGSNLAPSFSPDGQWITFTSYRDGDAEIYIMRTDGSDVTQLTFNNRPDWQPRWGP